MATTADILTLLSSFFQNTCHTMPYIFIFLCFTQGSTSPQISHHSPYSYSLVPDYFSISWIILKRICTDSCVIVTRVKTTFDCLTCLCSKSSLVHFVCVCVCVCVCFSVPVGTSTWMHTDSWGLVTVGT